MPAQATDGGPALTTLLLLALAIPLLCSPDSSSAAGERPPTDERGRSPSCRGARPDPRVREVREPDPGAGARSRAARGDPARAGPAAPHVQPQERRAALRERILRMRADGMTLQEIADLLTEEGEVTLGGARRWQPWSVRAATRPADPRGRHIADTRNGGRR